MKNDFKINTTKRNIIIAIIIALIVILSGITVGFALYGSNNEPADDSVVEVTTTETADEITEEPTSEITEEVEEVTTVASTEEVTTESTTESTTEKTTECTTESTTEEPVPTHTHNYTSKVTANPTCTKDGTTTYTCSCGDSYTTPISATGHDFGSNNKTCANCGTSNPNYVAPHTHSWVDKTWTETVHHDGEIVTLHACRDCGFTGTMAEVQAHQKTAVTDDGFKHSGTYSIGSEERGGYDETITHNYQECSCGERTGDVPR